MLSVVITESGRPVQHNLHALKLPGGQLAHLLDGASFTGGYSRSTSLTSMSTWACRICFSYSRHLKTKGPRDVVGRRCGVGLHVIVNSNLLLSPRSRASFTRKITLFR